MITGEICASFLVIRIEGMMPTDDEIRDLQPPASMSRLKVLLVLTMCCAHLPLLWSHLMGLWVRPHVRFLPFLMGVFAWLIWKRWPRRVGAEVPYVGAPLLELLLLGVSALLLSAGIWLNSPFLGTASAIIAVGYLIVSFGGLRAIESCIGAWALLWVMIPPPLGYDTVLISRLQAWTSVRASQVLDWLRIDHLMSGNVLTIGEDTFFVDEACSGVHSLFALIGFTAVFIVLSSRGLRRGLLLLAATIPWALFLNMLRIVAIAVFHSRLQIDLSTGWAHEVLGVVTFLIALSLTLSTDQMLGALGYWIRTAWTTLRNVVFGSSRASRRSSYTSRSAVRDEPPSPPIQPRRWVPAKRLGVLALCLYAVMGITQVPGVAVATLSGASWDSRLTFDEQSLPASFFDYEREGFEEVEREWSSDMGRFSKIWHYSNAQKQCVVSISFPFHGWHELTRCYEGLGWQIQDRTAQSVPEEGWQIVTASLTNESGEHAYLVYGFLNDRGAMLSPPSQLGVKRLTDRVQHQSTLQVQVFSPSNVPLSEADCQEMQNVLRQTIQRLKPSITEAGRG